MSTAPAQASTAQVITLGSAQTLAYASSLYLPAVLAQPMAASLGLAPAMVFAAFSLAVVVSAGVGPAAGRWVDRHGGRPVLMATNGLFALGLVALAGVQGPLSLLAAWVLIGLAMGSGLYEAAFATLVRLYGPGARRGITGITLIAGFASTVGWPLSAWMETLWGWRGACLGWAALHLLLGLPLNASLPRATGTAAPGPTPAPASTSASATATPAPPAASPAARRNMLLLSLVFAVFSFVGTSMAMHLPQLLQALGLGLAAAVAASALVGPAQVAGRLMELGFLHRVHPLLSARLAALTHPLGALLLLTAGGPSTLAFVFALLHGAGNGIITITKGTLPLALFGAQGYGARQGWLMLPTRVAAAAAPVLFGLVIDRIGAAALWLSTGLGLLAFAALMGLQPPQPTADPQSRHG
ncbi:MAG: MFS transporter [Burkholderiaceae bacterium]|nr:MFS transporter [Burkholderiaceae bacterium]